MKLKNILLTLFGLLIIFGSLVFYLVRAKAAGAYYGNTDFFKFYQSVLFYFSGQNIYDPSVLEFKYGTVKKWVTNDGNLNPPFLTLLLLPLHYFNYARALELWTKLSIILNVINMVLLLREFPELKRPLWKPILIIAAFMIYMPNSGNLAYGQLSAPLLFLTIILWTSARKKQDSLAGIALGLAAGIKVFYGLFFIYFLVLRRIRLFVVASIVYAMTLIAGLWAFGLDSYRYYFRILHDVRWYAASWNPSILGFFSRLFSASEKNIPLVNIPVIVVPLTVFFVGLLFIFLLRSWCKLQQGTQNHQLANDRYNLSFSLTLVGMLLISPLGWLYYFPILIIAYLVIVQQLAYLPKGYLLHLMACFALFISTLTGDLLVTYEVKTPVQVVLNSGYPIYSLLIILGLMIYLYRKHVTHQFSNQRYPGSISENYWLLIYIMVLTPSVVSMLQITRNMLEGNF